MMTLFSKIDHLCKIYDACNITYKACLFVNMSENYVTEIIILLWHITYVYRNNVPTCTQAETDFETYN